MNAKRANQIIQDIEALSGQTKEYPLAYWEAKQLLTDTKAAEPLLEVIEKQTGLIEELIERLGCVQTAQTIEWANKSLEETLSSSAQVVEKYQKETLGEP